MNEKLTPNNEQFEGLLQTPEHKALPTAEQAEPLRQGEKDPRRVVHEAREAIAETAPSESQLNPLERLEAAEKASEPSPPTDINRELKQITLRRELQRIRRELPIPQRVLSRIIHQPIIRKTSEVVGQTVSRPSGLLGGGLVALLGTSGYLYLAKHIGFRYNYGIFLLLFAGGFALGLLLEFLVYLAMTSRRKAND